MQFSPRQVPLSYRGKIRDELKRMESLSVISQVEEPTPWCSGMVAIPKRNGAIWIFVDLRPLNQSVCQEVYPLPKVDDLMAQMTNDKVFSKLDANSGFWQIPLSQESRLLTTFLTPMGRYCFNKLPFGITSTPELFQRCMNLLSLPHLMDSNILPAVPISLRAMDVQREQYRQWRGCC